MRKILISGLIAGVAGLAAAMAFGFLFGTLFPSIQTEYSDTTMYRPWDDPLMNLYWLYPFLIAFALAWAWGKVKSYFPGKLVPASINATLAYVFLATLPGMIISYSSYKMSFIMLISWFVSAFFQIWASMLVIAARK